MRAQQLAHFVLLGGLAAAAAARAGAAVPAIPGAAARASLAVNSPAAPARAPLPLAGVIRAAGKPVAGVTVVLRGVQGATGTALPLLSAVTGPDGTFVLPDAAPGAYALLALVPGFLPAVKGIIHAASADTLSFVAIDLEARSRERILPAEAVPGSDPWAARALLPGDPLRDVAPGLPGGDDDFLADDGPRGAPGTVLPALPGQAQAAESAPAVANLAGGTGTAAGSVRPVRAKIESLAGFGANGTLPRSRAALDVSGLLGEKVRWGVEGAFDRLAPTSGGTVGDGQRLALEIGAAPTPGQRVALPDSLAVLRVATRRQSLPGESLGADEARYAAHSVDATLPTGALSAASVSARMVSQSNFIGDPTAGSLFARDARAIEVLARYSTAVSDGHFVKVSVAYRSDSLADSAAALRTGTGVDGSLQEARLGGTAGLRVFGAMTVEGSLTGEVGTHSRGLVPELLVAVEPLHGVRVYGAVAQRFERALDPLLTPWGRTGYEEDLAQLSRAVVRGGVRFDNGAGDSLSLEGSRREMGSTFRYLLDPEFFDRIDAVYFFPGDVVTEASASATTRLGEGLQGRLSARGGRISGNGSGSGSVYQAGLLPTNDASFGRGEAAVHVQATGTDVSLGYRVVVQALLRTDGPAVHNDISAVDVTLAQGVPLPFLAAIGTQWRVLFTFEAGNRRLPDGHVATNRRLAGGVGLNF